MKFLCTADWHLRTDQLIARMDDFWETQKACLYEIRMVYESYNCDAILNAGDTLDKAKPDNAQVLENLIYDVFKDIPVYFVAGNHELLYHKIENMDLGSIGVISRFENWFVNKNIYDIKKGIYIYCYNYNQIIDRNEKRPKETCNIAILHKYTAKTEVPFFIKDGITAEELLDNYPDYNVFVTGDNHTGFIFEKNNRFVINPGRLNRQEADTKNYQPRVYILDTETKTVKTIYLEADIDLEAVTDLHITENKERDERISAFVESIKTGENVSLSFDDNVKEALQKSNLNEETKQIIEEWMEVKV